MKKLLMSFLVSGMLIVSVMSLSSCKKTDTNANANNEDWVPIVFSNVTYNGTQSMRDGSSWYNCDYCDEPLWLGTHGYATWDAGGPLCYEHYHFHCIEANQDCCPPNTPQENYYCRYRYVRKHQHVTSFTINWPYHNDSHVGGGTCP